MNQSAEATVWPLSRVRLSAGSVPRMLIFSPWPKALSMVTPGSVEIASATLVEGNLPTSSAVTTSMIASLLRLVSSACCRLARMPVTTTRSSSVASSAAASPAASWAWTGIAIPRHTAIAVESMDLRCLIVVLPITCLACGARRVAASWCPGGGLRARVVFLPDPVEVPAGGADHAQLPVLDQGHGNLLQRLAHRPLVEEAGDEAAAFEEVADLRQDPAGQVHAAVGAVEQRHVADRAAEQAAEQVQGVVRERVVAGARGGADRVGRGPRGCDPAHPRQRLVHAQQPGAG